MTIQRCRDILEEEAEGVTDDEIVDIINQAGILANAILDVVSIKRLTLNKKGFYDK